MTTCSAAIGHWQLGAIFYDASQRRLTGAGQHVDLEPRQHQLLLCLLQTPGQVVSRDTLIAQVWQGRIVSDSAINRAVSMLRKALAGLDAHTDYIETVPKLGYRLLPMACQAGEPAERQLHQDLPPLSGRRRYYRYCGLLVLIIAFMVWWFAWPVASKRIAAGIVVPHTSFNGAESHISLDRAATFLLYQRQSQQGNMQIWLNNLSDNSHHILTPEHYDSRYAAISPDGSRFAFVQSNTGNAQGCQLLLQHTLIQRSAETPAQRLHDCPSDNVPLLSWHPDGRTLYFRQRADKTQPYQFYQLNIASTAARQLTLLPADYSGLGDMALAASTQQLALLRYATADSTELLLLDPDNGNIITSQLLPLRATALAWHSEHTLLLSAGQMLYQYHLADAELAPLYQAAYPVNSFVTTTDTVYFSSAEFNTDIWYSDNKGDATQRVDSSRQDTMPRLAHHSQQLAFLSNRHGHQQLWLQQADGSERLLTELPGKPGFIRLEWSADDRSLLFSKEGAVYTVDIASAELKTLLPADNNVAVVNWGAQPNQLVYSSQRHGEWQLWLHDLDSNSSRQLTENGGYSGRIWQGRLYYSKYYHDGLWYQDLTTGDEYQLLAQFDKINWLNWHIDQAKLYYYQPGKGIYAFDLNRATSALHLPEPPQFIRHFSVRQGNTAYVLHGDVQGDIYRLSLR